MEGVLLGLCMLVCKDGTPADVSVCESMKLGLPAIDANKKPSTG